MVVRQVDAEQKRLRILNDAELEAIYGRPQFTQEERRNYFSLHDRNRNCCKHYALLNLRLILFCSSVILKRNTCFSYLSLMRLKRIFGMC